MCLVVSKVENKISKNTLRQSKQDSIVFSEEYNLEEQTNKIYLYK